MEQLLAVNTYHGLMIMRRKMVIVQYLVAIATSLDARICIKEVPLILGQVTAELCL